MSPPHSSRDCDINTHGTLLWEILFLNRVQSALRLEYTTNLFSLCLLTAHAHCSLQVEIWLTRLLATMKETVHYQMGEAADSYEEKPREQWIFDFPAQVRDLITHNSPIFYKFRWSLL